MPSLSGCEVAVTSTRILLVLFAAASYIPWAYPGWDLWLPRTWIRPRVRPVMLLVGDSLTEKGTLPQMNGWVTLLQYETKRSLHIVPRGLSGYNTRWYLKYGVPSIRSELSRGAYTPAVVTIWLGANDAALPNGSAKAQHVPLAVYKENLVSLVHAFQEMAPNAGILLITPPYVDDEVQEKWAWRSTRRGHVALSNAVTATYARACVETAHELRLPSLDLHTSFSNLTTWTRKQMLVDGLHLSARGNAFMYEQLKAKVDMAFPDVSRKSKRLLFPESKHLMESDPWNSTPVRGDARDEP
ncbi:hypothetical protein PsorP6_007873 [Peronosclerospora sorghi]|uniref:Uncharacterized protein n=1 Tax=Peronosclerospora sorghi TaxID=230839 RepID=A0ACC0WBT6_9STRA|nr:hypothetical protein PsorP6_007873 [Peronosclerospora sorghi]